MQIQTHKKNPHPQSEKCWFYYLFLSIYSKYIFTLIRSNSNYWYWPKLFDLDVAEFINWYKNKSRLRAIGLFFCGDLCGAQIYHKINTYPVFGAQINLFFCTWNRPTIPSVNDMKTTRTPTCKTRIFATFTHCNALNHLPSAHRKLFFDTQNISEVLEHPTISSTYCAIKWMGHWMGHSLNVPIENL